VPETELAGRRKRPRAAAVAAVDEPDVRVPAPQRVVLRVGAKTATRKLQPAPSSWPALHWHWTAACGAVDAAVAAAVDAAAFAEGYHHSRWRNPTHQRRIPT